MKTTRSFLVLALAVLSTAAFSQNNFPWERPLMIAWSNDGTTFGTSTVFQDSSGVPSVVRWKGDTLVSVFQWFRKPMNSVTWDKVAVKFSYNAGQTWTKPVPIIVSGLPGGYQRPFDPTLAVVSKTQLRIYFSSSVTMPLGGLDASVNTYSAMGTDGITFAFEPNPRFDIASKQVIDPAITFFNGQWHYTAPIGAPQEGAYHAVGTNGMDFIQQANIPSDVNHNWTGNLMVNSPTELRFYGSGPKMWFNASADGNAWQGFTNTNLQAGDPAVIRLPNTTYLCIFVGMTYITGTKEPSKEISLFPNPVGDRIFLTGPAEGLEYRIFSITGQPVDSGSVPKDNTVGVHALAGGLYFVQIDLPDGPKVLKFLK